MDIAFFEMHPNWDQMLKADNDLAIIRLEAAVSFSKSIAPIGMVAEGDETEVGEVTKVSGWGEIRKGSKQPKFLRAVFIPLVDLETCRNAHYDHKPEVTDRMICAGFLEGGLKI